MFSQLLTVRSLSWKNIFKLSVIQSKGLKTFEEAKQITLPNRQLVGFLFPFVLHTIHN